MPDDKSAPDFRLEFVPDKDFEDVKLADDRTWEDVSPHA